MFRDLRVRNMYFGFSDRLLAVHPDCGHDFPSEIRRQAYEFLDQWLGGKVNE